MDNDTLDYLREHGPKIGERAKSGDEKAKSVINLYGMYYRAPNRITLALLEAAIKDYQKKTMEQQGL